jgi:hypothetical protein
VVGGQGHRCSPAARAVNSTLTSTLSHKSVGIRACYRPRDVGRYASRRQVPTSRTRLSEVIGVHACLERREHGSKEAPGRRPTRPGGSGVPEGLEEGRDPLTGPRLLGVRRGTSDPNTPVDPPDAKPSRRFHDDLTQVVKKVLMASACGALGISRQLRGCGYRSRLRLARRRLAPR